MPPEPRSSELESALPNSYKHNHRPYYHSLNLQKLFCTFSLNISNLQHYFNMATLT